MSESVRPARIIRTRVFLAGRGRAAGRPRPAHILVRSIVYKNYNGDAFTCTLKKKKKKKKKGEYEILKKEGVRAESRQYNSPSSSRSYTVH